MRIITVVLGVALLVSMTIATHAQNLWVSKDGSIRNVDARALVVDKGGIYFATRNEVYRAKDAKDKWEPVFALPLGENEISCLAGKGKNILVGTRRGLYRSLDGGKSWASVFRTILPDKNNIYAIEISGYKPGTVVVGTGKGVFSSNDSGDRWHDISGNLKNKCVGAIALSKDSIFASCGGGLYIKRDGQDNWERAYVKSAAEKNTEELSGAADAEEPEIDTIGCVAFKGSRLFLGIDKRIAYSDTGGRLWAGFPSEGLKGTINYILAAEKSDKMYCATSKGVFEFSKEKSRWAELYRGMDRISEVYKLVFDNENESAIWALTEKGLYRLEGGRLAGDGYLDVERNMKMMKVMFDNEPAIRELQQAALKFAELGPEKIANWRNQARLRALVPKVSLGWDKNQSTKAEIYTSATKDYIVAGPDDITSGLDMSVSWELADLIWSDDQTNIDVRSRLNTQLRNDVLDDLRRACYERKRVQWELMSEELQDPKTRFEKELRLQELTQNIDDLTGNYLSDNIKKGQNA